MNEIVTNLNETMIRVPLGEVHADEHDPDRDATLIQGETVEPDEFHIYCK